MLKIHNWHISNHYDNLLVSGSCRKNAASQRPYNAIITSLWRQNDVATSFWHHNDVIFASCVRWDRTISSEISRKYENNSKSPYELKPPTRVSQASCSSRGDCGRCRWCIWYNERSFRAGRCNVDVLTCLTAYIPVRLHLTGTCIAIRGTVAVRTI